MGDQALVLPPEPRRQPLAQIPTAQDPTGMLAMIGRAASDPSMDVEKMERLVAMRDRELARTAEQAFNAALAEMQADLPTIGERGGIKDKQGNIQSRYALWEDINRAILPVLKQHGFALTFRQHMEGATICVTGVLSHRDGHSERTSITLPTDTSGSKNAVQAVGSSVQYGKRYTAGMLLNLTSSDDPADDGGAAGGAPVPMTEENQATVKALCEEIKPTTLKTVLKSYKVESLAEIPDAEYPSIVERLKITKHEVLSKPAARGAA